MGDRSIMQFDDIKSIGVVGAGQMGRGIAQVCATAGYQVLLDGRRRAAVSRGRLQDTRQP